MLDIKLLEKDLDFVQTQLERRGLVTGLPQIVALSKKRKQCIGALQAQQEQRNQQSQAMQHAPKEELEHQRLALRELSQKVKEQEKELADVEAQLSELLLHIPNIPLPDVPQGTSEKDNVEIKKVLSPTTFPFTPKDHVALGKQLGILDLERAAKISGSRFVFLCRAGALLNRALLQFFCDFHIKKGDMELNPPYLVLPRAMMGVGQFPKFKEDVFEVQRPNAESLYLIPTAEAPVTNYFAEEILDETQLPLRLCAYSPCFRSEAGAAGRDTHGMVRLHQFEKVEMVRFATKEQAPAELEAMVERASELLKLLELPHRIVVLCTGDMGFSSEKTYDLEVWLPGQNAYREISSCSSFGTFQSRRAQIKYRPMGLDNKKAKPDYVVTLNGSGLPLGRTLVAILENHQQADGSIRIPEVLWPYTNGQTQITGHE